MKCKPRVNTGIVCVVPVPRGQRPGRRCHACARPWEWTQSAPCRSPIRRCTAPSPPAPWPPTRAPDAGRGCDGGMKTTGEKRGNIWLALACLCTSSSCDGIGPPSGKNVHTSVGAKHDELTWFSSPFYAQIRTRATWPNARPQAVSQVYEAISEPVFLLCIKSSYVMQQPLYRGCYCRILKPRQPSCTNMARVSNKISTSGHVML